SPRAPSRGAESFRPPMLQDHGRRLAIRCRPSIRPTQVSLFLTWRMRLLCLTMIVFTAHPVAAQGRVGAIADVRIEIPSRESEAGSWSRTIQHPGATFLKLHFSKFELGPNDALLILDGAGVVRSAYTNAGKRPRWALSVPGDTVTVELRSSSASPPAWIVVD